MSVTTDPIVGVPEVGPGDDLAALLAAGIRSSELKPQAGDVVVVTQKVVSKAEGRVVPEAPDGKAAWVARETRRVVARRGDLVVAETRHGFVCANAGVDASNVGGGLLTLLPDDPDGSAERLRWSLERTFGVPLAVVITDTFGRTWRNGLVNVAIGCAGLPSMLDLRGTKDASGRILEATVVALADEIAAASGLVIGKADRVPAALVRGVRTDGPATPASALIRPPEADLFRESPLQAVASVGDKVPIGGGPLGRDVLCEAAAAALASLADGEASPPLAFVAVDSPAGVERMRRQLGDAAPRAGPGSAVVVVSRARSAAGETGVVGAAVQAFRIALHAQGVASGWSAIDEDTSRRMAPALDIEGEWVLAAAVTAWMAGGPAKSAIVPDPDRAIRFVDGPG
jgi:coenzyme F420-0:L-glutamate ligase/coenzyme F420-1:gamma-L-glutamate ligase